MKKMRFTIFLLIIGLFTQVLKANVQEKGDKNDSGKAISLMTYNLKFASPTFEPSWEVRREMQLDLIRKYDPDIIGTQEGLKEQIDYLADKLTDYVVVGGDLFQA